jgi:hypothetical protein
MSRFLLTGEEFHDVELEPEDRVTLGVPVDLSDVPRKRIALARPLVQPMDVSAVDADTRPFLQAAVGREFYLVRLGCSFRHDVQQPFISAWLQADLRLGDDSPDGIASAWSLYPVSLSDPAEMTREVEIDPSLKLTGVAGVSVDVGVSGKRSTQARYTSSMIFLEGLGAGTSSPAWSFTRTDAHEIRGEFWLSFVAEVSAGHGAEGVVSAGATIRKRTLRRSYVVALKDRPDLAQLRLTSTGES